MDFPGEAVGFGMEMGRSPPFPPAGKADGTDSLTHIPHTAAFLTKDEFLPSTFNYRTLGSRMSILLVAERASI